MRWFNRAKGYGFLLRNDGVTQAFIHMETVRRGGFENLLPGQSVEARIHDGPRGALAVVVRAAVPPSL
ncbi:cold shock domain-containing protein [Sandaracinobacter sp. RS1-74]|nr:cold shock domain-containing protein [Sandaracinobacteroides sayramensis]